MIITSFEEQINKDDYYGQQGNGEIIYRQRGDGIISSIARRFAFPALKNLYSTVAKPFVHEFFDEAKSAIKDSAVKKLQDLSAKIQKPLIDTVPPPPPPPPVEPEIKKVLKRKRKMKSRTAKKLTPSRRQPKRRVRKQRRRRKTTTSTRRKVKRKTHRKKSSAKQFDIFK